MTTESTDPRIEMVKGEQLHEGDRVLIPCTIRQGMHGGDWNHWNAVPDNPWNEHGIPLWTWGGPYGGNKDGPPNIMRVTGADVMPTDPTTYPMELFAHISDMCSSVEDAASDLARPLSISITARIGPFGENDRYFIVTLTLTYLSGWDVVAIREDES
jgi:hypothetical protein